jgi:hypothetical protein
LNQLDNDFAELRRVYVKGRNRYLGAANRERLKRVLQCVDSLRGERLALAKLAAVTPQFFNPMEACAAEALRDEILKSVAARKEETTETTQKEKSI